MKRIDDWDRGVKHCEDYIAAHGDLLCNCKYVADDGYNLGQWISRKRHAYKLGQLTDSEIAQLTRLGVLHRKSERSWETGCKHAAEYIMSTGNYDVPFEYCCADGFRLGVWVSYARNCLRNPGQRELSDSQRITFLSLGIPLNKHEDSWLTGFEHAEVFGIYISILMYQLSLFAKMGTVLVPGLKDSVITLDMQMKNQK